MAVRLRHRRRCMTLLCAYTATAVIVAMLGGQLGIAGTAQAASSRRPCDIYAAYGTPCVSTTAGAVAATVSSVQRSEMAVLQLLQWPDRRLLVAGGGRAVDRGDVPAGHRGQGRQLGSHQLCPPHLPRYAVGSAPMSSAPAASTRERTHECTGSVSRRGCQIMQYANGWNSAGARATRSVGSAS